MDVCVVAFYVWILYDSWGLFDLGKIFCLSDCKAKQPSGCRQHFVSKILLPFFSCVEQNKFLLSCPKNVVHGLFYCLIIIFVNVSF